jgi:hypothetical protein
MKNWTNDVYNAKSYEMRRPLGKCSSIFAIALISATVQITLCFAQSAQPQLYILQETVFTKSGTTVAFGAFCKKNDKRLPLKSAEAANGILETVDFGKLAIGPPIKVDPQFSQQLKQFCGE